MVLVLVFFSLEKKKDFGFLVGKNSKNPKNTCKKELRDIEVKKTLFFIYKKPRTLTPTV